MGEDTFLTYLQIQTAQFEVILDAELPSCSEVDLGRSSEADIITAMRYAALGGGKRLRPFLLIETAQILGVENYGVWLAAVALECVHAYSLVHDDLPCMDDDDLRRGRPTVHKAFNEALAVLAGDALLTHAFRCLTRSDIHADPQIRLQLVSHLARASGVGGMVGGQFLDISQNGLLNEAEVLRIQKLKTGALLEYAVQAGGLLGGADAAQTAALCGFAQNIGLAFQIKDDILDIEGVVDVLGKAVSKDARQGKTTFVSLLGLDGARQKARVLGLQAQKHMQIFGDKAHRLCQTVDFILERSH